MKLLVTSLLWYHMQAQQLFQKDSQIITPEALASVKAAIANSEKDKKVEVNKKAIPRKAAGQYWEDLSLADWPESKVSIVLFLHNFSRMLRLYDIWNVELGYAAFC